MNDQSAGDLPAKGYRKIIRVDSSTVFALKDNNHPLLGPVLEIKQLIKNGGSITEAGVLVVPKTVGGTKGLEMVVNLLEATRPTADQELNEWLTSNKGRATITSTTSSPVRRAQSYRKGAKRDSFIKERLGKPVTPDDLNEQVTNTKGLTVHDVIYQLRSRQPFEPAIELPLKHLKVVIAYGFVGWMKSMIASQVANTLVDHGILFHPKDDNTIRRVLHKLAEEGMVNCTPRVSNKGRAYNIWKFKKDYHELGLHFNGAGELVPIGEEEVDYRIEEG
ncbi:MAG: hypothetical protein ACXADA_05595 [Candidatus Hodarchaeales archaeon]